MEDREQGQMVQGGALKTWLSTLSETGAEEGQDVTWVFT